MKNSALYYCVVPVVILAIWQIISSLGLISPLFLASPHEVLLSFRSSILDNTLLTDAGYTLYRVMVSFIIAALIGVPLGLIMGYSNKVYALFEFTVEFFRSIPTTALFPLFLLAFGVGDEAKIAAAAWGATLVILLNSMYGVHLGKKLRLRVAKTMKIKGLLLFEKVIFPEALPHIFSGFRLAISLCVVIVIVTEMFIGTNAGLGKKIIDAQMVYQTPDMYVGIITAGLIGYILSKLMILLEQGVVHWRGR